MDEKTYFRPNRHMMLLYWNLQNGIIIHVKLWILPPHTTIQEGQAGNDLIKLGFPEPISKA